MVKIKRGDLDPKAFTHTLKGFYVKTWLGRPIVARSPRFGPRNGKASVWNRNQFGIAARMAASPLWLDQVAAMGLSKGTEQVPRDILMMAAYGNLFSIEFPDGSTTTVADHNYQPPPPDESENQMQAWAVFDNPWSNTFSSSPHCFKGTRFRPTADMEINGMSCIANWINGGTYRMLIAAVSGAGIITEITIASDKTATISEQQNWAFQGSGKLTAGEIYFIGIGRIDRTPTYAMPVNFEKVAQWTSPVVRLPLAYIDSVNPVIGTPLIQGATFTAIPAGYNYKVI